MSIENGDKTNKNENIQNETTHEKETVESLTSDIERDISSLKSSQGDILAIEKSVGLDEFDTKEIEKELNVTEVLDGFDREAEILKKEAEQGIRWLALDNHKFNEEGFYRIVDSEGYQDYLNTNILRSSPTGTKPDITPGGINIGNRPTSFPSFAKGEPDMNYLPKDDDGYIFESNVPMYARGDINPVTGNKIVGRHWAYRPIHEETGENITAMTPDMLNNIYKLKKDGTLHVKDKK